MSDFQRAVAVVLLHEGGLANNPNDPGGITNYGISLRYLQAEGLDLDGDGDSDGDDIRAMTREQAVFIYRTRWWEKHGYGRLVDTMVATKVFDVAVNMGATRSHLLAQASLRDVGYANFPLTGFLGPKTVEAVNDCEPRDFLLALCRRQQARYDHLIAKNPRLKEFAGGWAKRARWPFRPGEYV